MRRKSDQKRRRNEMRDERTRQEEIKFNENKR